MLKMCFTHYTNVLKLFYVQIYQHMSYRLTSILYFEMYSDHI